MINESKILAICYICSQPKNIEELTKYNQKIDKITNNVIGKCKQCINEYDRNRRKRADVKAKMHQYNIVRGREIAAKYKNTTKGQRTTKKYRQTETAKEKYRQASKRSREKYPNNWKARNAVHQAIERKELIKPNRCSVCLQEKTLNAHHHKGYEKKHWLSIIWLCIQCHTNEHKKTKDITDAN